MPGKIICELAPNQDNNRNSEGAFITLKNKDILFVYTRYRNGGSGDECIADLYGMVSKDSGETFGDPFMVLSCEGVGADNIMSVSLLRMENGDIGMFYLQKRNAEKWCMPYLTRSSDEGKTWSESVKCVKENGYFVLNNDRVIRLNNGRLLLAVARHSFTGDFGEGMVYVIASDDDGYTWKTLAEDIRIPVTVWNDPNEGKANSCSSAMEPGLVQLKNGRVWCYIRTMLGRQYEMFSDDNGLNWTIPGPSRFTCPCSPMSVKQLSNAQLLAIWNPIPAYNGRRMVVDGVWTDGRNPLALAILDKDAKTMRILGKLEDDESRGFCYCAIHELDNGEVLLAYCAGGKGDGACLNRIRVRKLTKEELT